MTATIMLGYVHPGMTHGHFPLSLLNMALDRANPIVAASASSYPSNAKARNHVISTFLDSDADNLLWVDDDCTVDSDGPRKLLNRMQMARADMAHAYSFGYNPETGRVYGGAWDYADEKWAPVDLNYEEIWVGGVGCHFGMINRSVYEAWDGPWHVDHLEHPETGRPMGHDLAFCLKAQQLGASRVLYTHHVQTGHLKDWNISWDDYMRSEGK
jgi:hypothetical protein